MPPSLCEPQGVNSLAKQMKQLVSNNPKFPFSFAHIDENMENQLDHGNGE